MPNESIQDTVRSILPRQPIRWFGAALAFGIAGAVVGIIVVTTGMLNLGAVAPHGEGVARIMHYTFQRSVAARAPDVPDGISLDDPALVLTGAGHYANVCSNCHGAPGLGQNPIPLSMRPEPPTLIHAADRYSDGELFRIVQSGARFTAMPAWPVGNRPDEVWGMVAFLKQLPTMSPRRYAELAYGDAGDGPVTGDRGSRIDEQDDPHYRRPYLAGDPQSIFATEQGEILPATGFMNTRSISKIADTCTKCHGADGAGRIDGAFPNLTLQSPEYIAGELRAFATGKRRSGIMWTVAANLSNDDIETLADHYGSMAASPSLGSRTSPDADGRSDLITRGEKIATLGIAAEDASETDPGAPRETKVQSCSGCHAILAKTTGSIPSIAGQNEAYLANQLRLFRSGDRDIAPMTTVSHDMEDGDIDALAAYYASLPPKKAAD